MSQGWHAIFPSQHRSETQRMHFRQPWKFSARRVGFLLLVLWLATTLVNMWVGVSKAGYSIKDEAPAAPHVFAVPANRCHCHLVEILCFLS